MEKGGREGEEEEAMLVEVGSKEQNHPCCHRVQSLSLCCHQQICLS